MTANEEITPIKPDRPTVLKIRHSSIQRLYDLALGDHLITEEDRALRKGKVGTTWTYGESIRITVLDRNRAWLVEIEASECERDMTALEYPECIVDIPPTRNNANSKSYLVMMALAGAILKRCAKMHPIRSLVVGLHKTRVYPNLMESGGVAHPLVLTYKQTLESLHLAVSRLIAGGDNTLTASLMLELSPSRSKCTGDRAEIAQGMVKGMTQEAAVRDNTLR